MPDFYMTMPSEQDEGGDIELTAPVLLEDGTIETDYAIASRSIELRQLAYFLIRTQSPDFTLHPEIGGNLEDIIGLPNNRSTADIGISKIKSALSVSPLFTTKNINVTATPISQSTILYIVTIQDSSGEIKLPISFNLQTGIQYRKKQVTE